MKASLLAAIVTFHISAFATDTGPTGKHDPGTGNTDSVHEDAVSELRYMHFPTKDEGSGKILTPKPSEKVPPHSLRIMSDKRPKEFDAMLAGLPPTKKFVVAKFGAGWCGPCKEFDRKNLPGIVHGVGAKFTDLSETVIIDDTTEADGTISTTNEVYSLPGFVLFVRDDKGVFKKVDLKEGKEGITTPEGFRNYFWDKLPPSLTGAQS